MKLNWSIFNIKYENPFTHDINIYNTRTKGIISLDNESYSILEQYINNSKAVHLDYQAKRYVAQLYRDGYLATGDEWEDFVQQRKKSYNELSHKFLFYFIPSWKCNFRCTYCHFYENIGAQSKISIHEAKQTAEYLTNYLIKLYQGSKKEVDLTVVLYGGEPLLMEEENEAFLSSLFEFSKNSGLKINISLSLITNGYLFDENTYNIYSKYNLIGAQITLDGERDYHNRKRFCAGNNKDTFDIILGNLKKAMNYDKLHITLRINIDEDNVDNIPALLKLLRVEGLDRNISLSISPVFSNVNVKGAIKKKNVLQKYVDIFRTATTLGFPFTFPTTSCSIYSREFLSMAFGKAYTCPSMCGSGIECIGDLEKPIDLMYERYKDIENFCRGCKWAPLCGSGCAYQNVKKGELVCLKSMYELMVEAYVLNYNVMNRYIGG